MSDPPSSSRDSSLPLRVAIIGGGSGGHLFPAIAVAQHLLGENPETRVLFLVSHRAIDAQVLSSVGWPDDRVLVQQYVSLKSGRNITSRLSMIPSALRAMRAARLALTAFQPDVAVGIGAFASVPGVIAASRRKIPIALLEHNSVPGRATRLLAKRAAVTIAGLPCEARYTVDWPSRLEVIGTPVRRAIADLAGRQLAPSAGSPRLLILGGSQGAHAVNRLVLDALADGRCLPPEWSIVHQTGESDVEPITRQYARLGQSAKVVTFLSDMPSELARASIAVSRAGAVTLQELACAGVPSILIPLSTAAHDHQIRNARYVAAAGGAMIVVETDERAVGKLKEMLKTLTAKASIRDRMSAAIRQTARPDAAAQVAAVIRELVRRE